MPSKKLASRTLAHKLRLIKIIILDVDGVLTDGRITIGSDGTEYKNFDAHDGYGITRALELGMKFAAISGRSSTVTDVRMKKLGVKEVYQNQMDKVRICRKLKSKYRLKDSEICFIGDDEFDLPLLSKVGLSAAPKDAMKSVLKEVDYVASKGGGRGAVREVVDKILRGQRLL